MASENSLNTWREPLGRKSGTMLWRHSWNNLSFCQQFVQPAVLPNKAHRRSWLQGTIGYGHGLGDTHGLMHTRSETSLGHGIKTGPGQSDSGKGDCTSSRRTVVWKSCIVSIYVEDYTFGPLTGHMVWGFF